MIRVYRMKVTIRQIEYRSGQFRVEWTSEVGSAWALWCGESPQAGVAYDVEIDFPAIASMEIVSASTSEKNPSVWMGANSTVVLVGTLVRDHAGGASLQLGDSVILLDGPVESFENGAMIRCTALAMTMFPVDL
jgi:hypothetical protein